MAKAASGTPLTTRPLIRPLIDAEHAGAVVSIQR
jgi:hypothetical protein